MSDAPRKFRADRSLLNDPERLLRLYEISVNQRVELVTVVEQMREALGRIADPDERHSARARLIARETLGSAITGPPAEAEDDLVLRHSDRSFNAVVGALQRAVAEVKRLREVIAYARQPLDDLAHLRCEDDCEGFRDPCVACVVHDLRRRLDHE